jgi:transcriptional regulator with XRE-family HTH domain
MRPTPGQLLRDELKRQKISKSDFAKRVKRTFQTVFNWGKDEGFGPEQRALAAAELKQPPDFFDHPDLVRQREEYRELILKEFAEDRLGKTLTKEEWRSLHSFRWPEGREPTVSDCKGLVRIMRNQLTQAEYDASADDMRAADSGRKTSENRDAPATKKLSQRGKPIGPHKRPRK